MEYFRHGDVHVISVDQLPGDLVEEKGETVLEHGEVTGHAHRLESNDFAKILRSKATGTRYLRVVKPVALKHEEHHTRTIPPGTYEIRRTRETDHMEGVTRIVAD